MCFQCWTDSWLRWLQRRHKNKLCFFFLYFSTTCEYEILEGGRDSGWAFISLVYSSSTVHKLFRTLKLLFGRTPLPALHPFFTSPPQPPEQTSLKREKEKNGLRTELQELLRRSQKHQRPHQSSSCVLRVADSNDHLVWGLHPL